MFISTVFVIRADLVMVKRVYKVCLFPRELFTDWKMVFFIPFLLF